MKQERNRCFLKKEKELVETGNENEKGTGSILFEEGGKARGSKMGSSIWPETFFRQLSLTPYKFHSDFKQQVVNTFWANVLPLSCQIVYNFLILNAFQTGTWNVM